MFKYLALGLALALTASVAQASLTINVGDTPLLPDTANQLVPIYITGDGVINVTSVTVQCQIEDGGPLVSGHGSAITLPTIENLDVIDGATMYGPTLFTSNNNGQNPSDADFILYHFPQLASRGTITDHDTITVPTRSLLAIVTISTLGCTTLNQSFALKLADTANTANGTDPISRSTHFDEDVLPVITNGTIYISQTIPEPSTCVLVVAGAGLLLRRRKMSRQLV